MAIKQYIGARYVPKFATPIEWQENTAYEGMTIVTYNNSSYTSKKSVPTTVGIPPQNDEYWALTGNYNAQVEEYRQDTLTYKETVDTLKTETETNFSNLTKPTNDIHKRTFLLMGDSYSGGYSPSSTEEKGWSYWCKQYLENKGFECYISSDIRTTPYGTAFYGPKTYTMQLEQTVVDKPEIVNANITDIVIYTGTNDSGYTTDQINSGIQEFVNKAKEYFPYATIKIGYFSSGYGTSNIECIHNFEKCGQYGCVFIDGSQFLCSLKKYVDTDNVHLTQDGYKFYSDYLVQGAIDGHMTFHFDIEEDISFASISESYFDSVDYLTVITNSGYQVSLNAKGGAFGFIQLKPTQKEFVLSTTLPSITLPVSGIILSNDLVLSGTTELHAVTTLGSDGLYLEFNTTGNDAMRIYVNKPLGIYSSL